MKALTVKQVKLPSPFGGDGKLKVKFTVKDKKHAEPFTSWEKVGADLI